MLTRSFNHSHEYQIISCAEWHEMRQKIIQSIMGKVNLDNGLREVYSEKVTLKLRLVRCRVNFGVPVVWKFVRIRENICQVPSIVFGAKVIQKNQIDPVSWPLNIEPDSAWEPSCWAAYPAFCCGSDELLGSPRFAVHPFGPQPSWPLLSLNVLCVWIPHKSALFNISLQCRAPFPPLLCVPVHSASLWFPTSSPWK